MSAHQGFAVWMTGLPASGKSSISRELVLLLEAFRIPVVVLESDVMRGILTPGATYGPEERDKFYRTLVLLGDAIIRSNVNVIFDATANRRAYRDYARALIPKFVEVYVDCPLDICMKRDPKGIYRRAISDDSATVPGLQSAYEPPNAPEVVLDCRTPAKTSATVIVENLKLLFPL